MSDLVGAQCSSIPGDVLRDVTTSVVGGRDYNNGGVKGLVSEEKIQVEEVCLLLD